MRGFRSTTLAAALAPAATSLAAGGGGEGPSGPQGAGTDAAVRRAEPSTRLVATKGPAGVTPAGTRHLTTTTPTST